MTAAVFGLLLAAAVTPFFIGRLGAATGWVAGLLPAALFAYFARLVPKVSHGDIPVEVRPWVEPLGVNLAFRLDGLSLLFALMILGIGTLIAIYAGGYLHGHPRLGRFYGFFFLFMASMLGLVLADDVFALFVFWELTSFASFLLIGFEHKSEDNRAAARQALVVTGSGGLALLGGLILLVDVGGTSELSRLIAMGDVILADPRYPWILGLVLIGAFTKSAQVPFHFWLPAAMAGPTPVSAYLHSATMVKAGVFLLARLSPALSGTEAWTICLVAAGGATMVLSAWACFAVSDLKQVLAYTTTMALGLFVLLLGMGDGASIEACGFYLVVHALYKAGLFMAVGCIDHETGTRDLSRLSGLRKAMPLTAAAVGMAAASMAGLPPFLGFVGKEATYEAALHLGTLGWIALALMLLANVALIATAAVLFIGPFFGSPKETPKSPHEGPLTLWLGPVVLGLGALALGPLTPWLGHDLIEPMTQAVYGSHESHPALWHGVTPALGLSVLTVALGLAVFGIRDRVRGGILAKTLGVGFVRRPGLLFERVLLALHQAAERITGFIHTGQLRRYLAVSLAVLALAAAIAFTERVALDVDFATLADVRIHEWILVGLLLASSFWAATSQAPLRAILALGVSGYCVALIYLLFGAPDLGMTQFSIETLTVILVALIFVHLPETAYDLRSRVTRTTGLIISVLMGAVMTGLTLAILSVELPLEISKFYAAESYVTAHGHNIVNVILVDFRGFDTWGEITVLTVAGLGVYSLLRRSAQRTETGLPDEELEASQSEAEDGPSPTPGPGASSP